MLQSKKYRKNDPEFVLNFIKAHPFATLVIQGEEMMATHIPIISKGGPENFLLYGHVSKNNPQHEYLHDGVKGLLIFQGAQGYVSSSWYREKDISTWDYSAVHLNVVLKIQTQDELKQSLKELVDHFEQEQETPLYFEQLPKSMIDSHLPLITGFSCTPEKIEAIAKLHQGYQKHDVEAIVEKLSETELAADLRKEHRLK